MNFHNKDPLYQSNQQVWPPRIINFTKSKTAKRQLKGRPKSARHLSATLSERQKHTALEVPGRSMLEPSLVPADEMYKNNRLRCKREARLEWSCIHFCFTAWYPINGNQFPHNISLGLKSMPTFRRRSPIASFVSRSFRYTELWNHYEPASSPEMKGSAASFSLALASRWKLVSINLSSSNVKEVRLSLVHWVYRDQQRRAFLNLYEKNGQRRCRLRYKIDLWAKILRSMLLAST